MVNIKNWWWHAPQIQNTNYVFTATLILYYKVGQCTWIACKGVCSLKLIIVCQIYDDLN